MILKRKVEETLSTYEIEIPVFNQYFYLSFWQKKEFIKLTELKSWEKYEKDYIWLTLAWDEIFVNIDKVKNKLTLNHEMIHVTYAILENKWIPSGRDNEEIFAYLHSYLMDRCSNLKNEKKVEISLVDWYNIWKET